MNTFRGYDLNHISKDIMGNWEDYPCGHCGLYNTVEGHDGCLGTIPNVMNACCGHGDINQRYVQFWSGCSVRKQDAIDWLQTGVINKLELPGVIGNLFIPNVFGTVPNQLLKEGTHERTNSRSVQGSTMENHSFPDTNTV